jgi:uncharacterized protein YlaI
MKNNNKVKCSECTRVETVCDGTLEAIKTVGENIHLCTVCTQKVKESCEYDPYTQH